MRERVLGLVVATVWLVGCGPKSDPDVPAPQAHPALPPGLPPAPPPKQKPSKPAYGIERGGMFLGRWCDEFVHVDRDGDLFRRFSCTGEVFDAGGWHLLQSLGPGFFDVVARDFESVVQQPPEQPSGSCPNGAVSFHLDGATTYGVCIGSDGHLPDARFDPAYQRVLGALKEQ